MPNARIVRSSSRVATVLIASTALFACDGAAPDDLDLLVLGGTVIDGSGGDPTRANVGVRGDRIVWVGGGDVQASDTLDATGLVVAPGFIDVHSHTVPALLDAETRMNEGVLRQGVTTVIGGPDGRFDPEIIRQVTEALRTDGSGTNVGVYVGHNAIRRRVMGTDQQRAPTPEELEEMKASSPSR